MSRKQKAQPVHTCGDCAHGIGWPGPPGNPWNIGHTGEPITLHCHQDPEHVKRGLFRSDPACQKFKPKCIKTA